MGGTSLGNRRKGPDHQRHQIGRQRQGRLRSGGRPARLRACSTVCGALLTAIRPGGVRKVTVKGVLKPGSSNPGKAARASIDWNWLQLYQSLADLDPEQAGRAIVEAAS